MYQSSLHDLMTMEPTRVDHLSARQPRYEAFHTKERSFVFTDVVGFGKRCSCVITRGDVNESLYMHYLRLELPPLKELTVYDIAGSPALEFRWADHLGFAMIESVQLSLNDTVIETHPGEWLFARASSDLSSDAMEVLRRMVRSKPTYGPDLRGEDRLGLCVPLCFFFGESMAHALPMMSSMDKSTVKFIFKFRSLWELLLPVPVEGAGKVRTAGLGPGSEEVLWTSEDLVNQLELGNLSLRDRLPIIMNSIDVQNVHRRFDVLSSSMDCVLVVAHPTRTLRLKNSGWKRVVRRVIALEETVNVDNPRNAARELRVSLPFTGSVSEIVWVFRRENSNAFNRFMDFSEDMVEAGLVESGNEIVRAASLADRGNRTCFESSGSGVGNAERIGVIRFAERQRDYFGMRDLTNPQLVLLMRGGTYSGRLLVFVVTICRVKWGGDGSFVVENTVRVSKKKTSR
jgi:hypothetical protein